jgi:hypothetical protein
LTFPDVILAIFDQYTYTTSNYVAFIKVMQYIPCKARMTISSEFGIGRPTAAQTDLPEADFIQHVTADAGAPPPA